MKKAIVVVSFGTSIKRAYETGIKPIEDAITDKFYEYDIIQSYTSSIIRKKLEDRDGIKIFEPYKALEKLCN